MIMCGAPDRWRLSVVLYDFHFSSLALTVDLFTQSGLLLLIHSILMQVYYFVPGGFQQIFDLSHSGNWTLECLRPWTDVFYTETSSTGDINTDNEWIVEKLQVCESQRSATACLFWTKYLFSSMMYKYF